MLVVYEGLKETIITSLEDESSMLTEYFADHTGRNVQDYERTEAKDMRIEATLDVRTF